MPCTLGSGPRRVLLAAALALACASPARASLTLQVTPAIQTVTPGTDFDVKLRVIGPSPAFNAFHAILQYDPAMLTPVQLSPIKTQVDSLFSPCTNLFHKFRYGSGLDSIDVSMLCNGVTTQGPGAVYHLRFHAANRIGVTQLTVRPDVSFANGGVYLTGVTANGAAIGVGTSVLDAGEAPASPELALAIAPNPGAGETRIDFGRPIAAAGVFEIHDVMGRMVLRRALAPGSRQVNWDGRDEGGRAVRAGMYFAVLRADSRVASRRMVRTN